MSYEIKIPKSILKDFKIDLESSTENVLVLRTSTINTDQEASAFVRKFGHLIGTKYILNFTNPNPKRIVFYTQWICKYSKRNKAPYSKSNLNCEATISYKIKKNNFRSQPPIPGILKISLKHSHPLERVGKADCILWSEEIKKLSTVPTKQIPKCEESTEVTNENNKADLNLSIEEQTENDPENLQREKTCLNKKKPLHPNTKFGRPPRKVKEISKTLTAEKTKANLSESDTYKKISNNLVDSNSEKQTKTLDSPIESDSHGNIIPSTETTKIEKDIFITQDNPTVSVKKIQSTIPTNCTIETKNEKLTNSPLNDPTLNEIGQTIIQPNNSNAYEEKTPNIIHGEIVNKNGTEIISILSDPIISESINPTVLPSSDHAAIDRGKQYVRPPANENKIIIPSIDVFESQAKSQTMPASCYFQPIVETSSLQSKQISQTSVENQKVNIFLLQVQPNYPLLKPGVEVKDLILPAGIPPLLPLSTNTMTSNKQNSSKAPKLSGSSVSNGTRSNPIVILRPLDNNSNLPTTILTSATTYSITSSNLIHPQPIKQSKQCYILPETMPESPKSPRDTVQRLYIKEEPIDIIDDEIYELSDASMKNSFIPLDQPEHTTTGQLSSPEQRDIGEEINRCYSYAEKLFKRLKSERLSMEENSSVPACPSPKIFSKQSDKRKKRKADADETDSNRKQTEDEVDSYCKTIAMRLKNLDSETSAFVQKAIDNLLCDAEVGLGEFLHEKKDGERSLRECATPTYLSLIDEPTSPFSLGGSSMYCDSESTLTAFSDSSVSS